MPNDQTATYQEALRQGFKKDFDCDIANWPIYAEKFYYKKMDAEISQAIKKPRN